MSICPAAAAYGMIANEIISDWHSQEKPFRVVSFRASDVERLAVLCIVSAGLDEYLSPVKTHDLQMQPDI